MLIPSRCSNLLGWNDPPIDEADAASAAVVADAEVNATEAAAAAAPVRKLVYDARCARHSIHLLLITHCVLPSFFAALCFPVAIALQVLTFLATHWSVNFDAFVKYTRVSVRTGAAASNTLNGALFRCPTCARPVSCGERC